MGLVSLPVSYLTGGNPVLESTGSLTELLVNSKRTYASMHLPGLLLPVSLFLEADRRSKDYSVDYNKLWKILKETGIPDHLTCFLKSWYTGQESTIRVELDIEKETGLKLEKK